MKSLSQPNSGAIISKGNLTKKTSELFILYSSYKSLYRVFTKKTANSRGYLKSIRPKSSYPKRDCIDLNATKKAI